MYLNCKTYFSFKYGTYSTAELVAAAVEKGITSLTPTNINSTCDTWDFIKQCLAHGIKPSTGVEIRNGNVLLYLLIAANNKGQAWIYEFLSQHLIEKKPFPDSTQSPIFFLNICVGFVI